MRDVMYWWWNFCACALYSTRFFETFVISGAEPDQLSMTTLDYPGFPEGIMGPT